VSRTWKIVIGVVVLLLIAGAATAAALSFQGRGPEIETATVEKVDLSVSVTASGKVEAGRRADVYPPTAGTLAAIYVNEGDEVKAGAKIALLDAGPLELAVEQAKAGIAQANAQLETVNNQAPAGPDYVAASAAVTAARSANNAAVVAFNAVDDGAPTAQQLDAADAAVEAAEAGYKAAKYATELAKAAYETTPTPDYLLAYKQAQAAQAQASAGLSSSKASLQALEDTDLSSAKASARSAVAQSTSALRTAQANQSKLARTSVSAQREAARAAVRQADAALGLAQKNLDGALMTAPIDGTVFFNSSNPAPQADGQTQEPAVGAGVAQQAPPFSVVDLSGSTFVAEVDEADIARVKPDMATIIRFDAYPGDDVKTTVTAVQAAARQTATGGTVFPVDLSLADVAVDLLIGMKGDAEIKVKAVPTALVIPIEALFDENGTTFVYVLEAGTLKKTEIKVGATTDTQVQVIRGVKEGDEVALSGAETLTDGMAVRVKP